MSAIARPARPRGGRSTLLSLCLADFGAMISFNLLFPVMPLYAAAGSEAAAGLVTGVLMFATVAAEVALPFLAARIAGRTLFSLGLVLLGAPALVLGLGGRLPLILAVCALRGFGLGVVMVVGSSLVAAVTSPDRRGAGLGLYSAVSGVASIATTPLAAWLVGLVGYTPLFMTGALTALAGLAAMSRMPNEAPGAQAPIGILAGLRRPAVLGPALVLLAVAMASGVTTSFLPLIFPWAASPVIALALLAQGIAAIVVRWLAGQYAHRLGQGRLMVFGILAAASGMIALAFAQGPVPVVMAEILVGSGFGAVQNSSLSLMFERVPASGYTMASAVWNLAYDAGLGLGAVVFGALAVPVGYPVAVAVIGGAIVAALVPAWYGLDRPATCAGRSPDEALAVTGSVAAS